MGDAVHDSIVVDAPADTVLQVVTDVAAYPQWQREVKSVEVLSADPQGRPQTARFVVDIKVVTTSFVLAYSYAEHEMRWQLVEGEGLRRNDGSYVLEPRADGTTRVTYSVEIETTLSVPSLVRRQVAKRVVDTALRQMKRRAESMA